MYFHRSEVFAILSASIFIQEYARFNLTKIRCPIHYMGDNKEIITKLSNLIKAIKYYDKIYRIIDHDAILQIKLFIPNNTTTENVHSHQENFNEISMAAKVNTIVDKISDKHARKLIQTHILNINNPIAIYAKQKIST